MCIQKSKYFSDPCSKAIVTAHPLKPLDVSTDISQKKLLLSGRVSDIECQNRLWNISIPSLLSLELPQVVGRP